MCVREKLSIVGPPCFRPSKGGICNKEAQSCVMRLGGGSIIPSVTPLYHLIPNRDPNPVTNQSNIISNPQPRSRAPSAAARAGCGTAARRWSWSSSWPRCARPSSAQGFPSAWQAWCRYVCMYERYVVCLYVRQSLFFYLFTSLC